MFAIFGALNMSKKSRERLFLSVLKKKTKNIANNLQISDFFCNFAVAKVTPLSPWREISVGLAPRQPSLFESRSQLLSPSPLQRGQPSVPLQRKVVGFHRKML